MKRYELILTDTDTYMIRDHATSTYLNADEIIDHLNQKTEQQDNNDILGMTVKDFIEEYMIIVNEECGYHYGIAPLHELDRLYEEYDIVEEYPEAFCPIEIIPVDINIYDEKAIISYERLERIMDNLGIGKK